MLGLDYLNLKIKNFHFIVDVAFFCCCFEDFRFMKKKLEISFFVELPKFLNPP